MFPQELVNQHEIAKSFKTNIIAWYNNCIEGMEEKSDILTIWETRKVHRDRELLHDNEYRVCEYKGQFSRTCNDKIMEKIIEKKQKAYYFVCQTRGHKCYEIMKMILVEPRTNTSPPIYRIHIKERHQTPIIKERFPAYFNNIFRHPITHIKLMSLAKFGFVPRTTNNNGVGQVEAYEIV